MKFDQYLWLNLQYDFGKMNSTLGSVVPLAMFGCKIVVFVIVIQSYLCNGTFSKLLLSCGDAVVLLVAGKR